MPGEDFHLSDLARFQAHPRTPPACGSPGFMNPRWLATLRSPGANFLSRLRRANQAARKGCEDISPGLSEAIPGVTATPTQPHAESVRGCA